MGSKPDEAPRASRAPGENKKNKGPRRHVFRPRPRGPKLKKPIFNLFLDDFEVIFGLPTPGNFEIKPRIDKNRNFKILKKTCKKDGKAHKKQGKNLNS